MSLVGGEAWWGVICDDKADGNLNGDGVVPEVEFGDVHLGVLGPRVRLFQPDVQLLDLVLHIFTFVNLLIVDIEADSIADDHVEEVKAADTNDDVQLHNLFLHISYFQFLSGNYISPRK